MKKSGFITIIVLVLILVGAALYAANRVAINAERSSEAAQTLGTDDEENAAAFTDLEGNPIALSDYQGQVRVVNSWASWCPFCVNELPDFAELARTYEEENVVVLAINRKESAVTARAFIESVEGVDEIIFVQDPDDVFYRRIGGFSMPETVFYDVDGNIVFHKRGFMTLDEMRTHTEAALEGVQEE